MFPPEKFKKLINWKVEKKEIDEIFFYREDKYNYKELEDSINSKDTIYQWRRVYVRENKNKLCPP